MIKVHNWSVQPNGSINQVNGWAYFKGAKGSVHFPPSGGGDYEVISTDYVNYAIVSSCTEHLFGLFHYQTAWILARTNNWDDSAQRSYIDNNMKYYSTSRLLHTVQGN